MIHRGHANQTVTFRSAKADETTVHGYPAVRQDRPQPHDRLLAVMAAVLLLLQQRVKAGSRHPPLPTNPFAIVSSCTLAIHSRA